MDASDVAYGTIVCMRWNVKKQPDDGIDGIDEHPIVGRILRQRGIHSLEDAMRFLHPNYDTDLHDPFLFCDMEQAVTRICTAIDASEEIAIFGDHDADGVSSAALLAEGLELLGARVTVYIPDKITEGHGINTDAIDLFATKGIAVMISVDCGTSSHEAVTYARDKGMDVIITDHHHAPAVLPDAYAIINPRIARENYPFKDLSGTAVAFKLLQAVVSRRAPQGIAQLKWLLDIVCVGTVADCVPLVGENRVLVTYGLVVLRKMRRMGYRQLCVVGKFCNEPFDIRSETVAYYIAPRINAAGRMRHAQHAYELVRESRVDHAHAKAVFIEQLNEERKKVTDQITRHAEKIIETEQKERACIIIGHESYPAGIVGIVAGRIAEKYKKPTGIFARFATESRGSFRSVAGVHIVDVLRACETHLVKYGGHEKAAGATVTNEAFDDFTTAIDEYVASIYDHKNEIYHEADMEIVLTDVSIDLARSIVHLEPFGEGNQEPIFMIRNVMISEVRSVGATGVHSKITLSDNECHVDGIGFYMHEKIMRLDLSKAVDVVAYVRENVWNGVSRTQLQLVDVLQAA